MQKNIYMCLPHLQLWEVHNSDFQLYSLTISIKQLIVSNVNCGTLLAYVTVTVQSDILLELQQHLFERWTAFQQHVVHELID